jgi:hypothetical protein
MKIFRRQRGHEAQGMGGGTLIKPQVGDQRSDITHEEYRIRRCTAADTNGLIHSQYEEDDTIFYALHIYIYVYKLRNMFCNDRNL